jgi:hypothetical protein
VDSPQQKPERGRAVAAEVGRREHRQTQGEAGSGQRLRPPSRRLAPGHELKYNRISSKQQNT